MQAVYEDDQATAIDTDASVARVEQVQKLVKEVVVSVSDVQKLLNNLRTMITAPTK